MCWQAWYSRTPLGKKKLRATKTIDEEGDGAKGKGTKGKEKKKRKDAKGKKKKSTKQTAS